MNKYTGLSDFEINKKVASHYLPCDYNLNEHTKTVELISFLGDTDEYNVYGTFNPCNNPADAMPIIIENGIDLLNGENMMPELFGHHSTYTLHNFNTPIAADSLKEDKTIYRLGMEAFLMKKDAENES